ncbi:bis(5'-adenosyl)-triphosphatase enpp4-like [Diadema antillarum]|uniref:bis(5'-adenosyl)-triphosphatase enpp4-like n=1 Tax=Diadema antillarum TaxID=105358 RepID=UPI003A853106
MDHLNDAGLLDKVNVIVTGDHGMTAVSPQNTVFLDDLINRDLYHYTDNDPVFGIWPYESDDRALIFEALRAAGPMMNVYWKEEIPEEFHYRDNRRISPLLIVMEEGWHVWTNRSVEGNWMNITGNDGFLNTLPSMQTIFIASGPAFKSNFALTDSFDAVDIYNLMCHVLEIDPAPNNGTPSNITPLLVNDVTTVLPSLESSTTETTGDDLSELGKLILVVFDGFRADYLEKRDILPAFNELRENGATAPSVIPPFASKTFPSLHSIATGLYQEAHGIVGNNMYDPDFDSTFDQTTTDPRWWNYGGEPIWVTNQLAGGRSVSSFYPGANVEISGQTATYCPTTYNGTFQYFDRIDTVIDMMKEERTNLGLLYFDQPGTYMRGEGPDSDAMLGYLDQILFYLMDHLNEAGLLDEVNVIVTGDHGMTAVSPQNTIFLDDLIDRDLYHYTDNDPVFGIWPYESDDTSTIYEALEAAHPNMNVYLKEDIPEEFRYRDNRRTSPILIVMDEGWHVWTNRSIEGNWMNDAGNDGFLNTLPSMQTIFIASGPAFKSNFALTDSFDAVDIYNLMCHVLEIDPAPNDGTPSNITPLLVNGVTTVLPSVFVLILSLTLGYSLLTR